MKEQTIRPRFVRQLLDAKYDLRAEVASLRAEVKALRDMLAQVLDEMDNGDTDVFSSPRLMYALIPSIRALLEEQT